MTTIFEFVKWSLPLPHKWTLKSALAWPFYLVFVIVGWPLFFLVVYPYFFITCSLAKWSSVLEAPPQGWVASGEPLHEVSVDSLEDAPADPPPPWAAPGQVWERIDDPVDPARIQWLRRLDLEESETSTSFVLPPVQSDNEADNKELEMWVDLRNNAAVWEVLPQLLRDVVDRQIVAWATFERMSR